MATPPNLFSAPCHSCPSPGPHLSVMIFSVWQSLTEINLAWSQKKLGREVSILLPVLVPGVKLLTQKATKSIQHPRKPSERQLGVERHRVLRRGRVATLPSIWAAPENLSPHLIENTPLAASIPSLTS